MQTLRTAQQRDTAALRTAVAALETSGKTTADAAARTDARVGALDAQVKAAAERVTAGEAKARGLEVKFGVVDARQKDLEAQQQRDVAQLGGQAKEHADATAAQLKSVAVVANAARGALKTVIDTSNAAVEIAKDALARATAAETKADTFDAAISGLALTKMDKAEFFEQARAPDPPPPEEPEPQVAAAGPVDRAPPKPSSMAVGARPAGRAVFDSKTSNGVASDDKLRRAAAQRRASVPDRKDDSAQVFRLKDRSPARVAVVQPGSPPNYQRPFVPSSGIPASGSRNILAQPQAAARPILPISPASAPIPPASPSA
jgi:hypothetical protein